MKRKDVLLISCSGLGMGNASRVIAVVEALWGLAEKNNRDLELHIVSWGAGYRFLKAYQESGAAPFTLIAAHQYPALSFTAAWTWMRSFGRNVGLLRRKLRELNPTLIILDSDYHFPAYFRFDRPIVYIGQAEDVVERARASSYRPGSWREVLNFNLREKLDALVQRRFAHEVLVPCFRGTGKSNGKVRRIPLIVRKEFLAPAEGESAPKPFGLLLSGSGIGKDGFISAAEHGRFEVMAPVPSRARMIDQFEMVCTQGGLSSISECIARGKFLVVVPINEHPEQMLNAMEVEQLGLGIRSSLEEIKQLPRLFDRVREKQKKLSREPVGCNGAEIAAEAIYGRIFNSERALSY